MSEKQYLLLIGFLGFFFGYFLTHSIVMVLTNGK